MTTEATTIEAAAVDTLPAIDTPAAAPRGRLLGRMFAAVWRLLVAFAVTLIAVSVLAVAFTAGLAQLFDGRVLPGITVGGVPIGGLDRAAAAARLSERLPSLTSGHLVLLGGGEPQSIGYAELGRGYDLAPMLDAAFAVGRTGTPVERALVEVRTLFRGETVEPRIRYDEAAVERAIAAAADSLAVPPSDASVALGRDGFFAVAAGTDGQAVDRDAAVREADAALGTDRRADTQIWLARVAVSPAITNDEAEAARLQAVRMTLFDVTVAAGSGPKEQWTIPATTLRGWVAFVATPDGGYMPTVATAAARAWIAKLAPKVQRDPVDAKYLTGKGSVVGVLPAVVGRSLDVDGSLQTIDQALAARGGDDPPTTASLAMLSVDPKVTTAEAQQTAPLMTRVSTWTTHFFPSEANYWGRNISIPTSAIDGYVVAPHTWFDFWTAVGEVSTAKGYGQGGVIVNGHSHETGALGGGICSCSTTLFNAAARAGLQIGARANHYYYISRYPVGLDATVFQDGSSVQTMSFYNDTAYPILIRGINGSGVVRFDLYSVPIGRTVTFSTPIVKNYTRAQDHTVYTTSLKPGQQNRVEYATDGFDAWVTRTVTDATGKVIHEETFYSHYARVDGLLEIGVKPGDPRLPTPSPVASPSPGASAAPVASPSPAP